MSRRSHGRVVLAIVSLAMLVWAFGAAQTVIAEPGTLVFINGKPNRVFFNDGDSFRVLAGPRMGQKTRLGGYNTLESFGPTHSWGTWQPFELYVIAKKATLNARTGIWHCTTDESTDTYGRLLMHCPDLMVDQIKKGFAMAYTIDEKPAEPELLRAQVEAIAAGRGMWAHGVPEFVMTSVHSANEGRAGTSGTYNRLISTRDGHTEKWKHDISFSDCTRVCNTEVRPDRAQIRDAARAMRSNPELAPMLKDWFNVSLEEFAARWVRSGELPEYLPAETKVHLRAWFAAEKASGRLGKAEKGKGSCMLYVPFERWYGNDRAQCLHEKTLESKSK